MLFEALLLLNVLWNVFSVWQAMDQSKMSGPQPGGGTDNNASDLVMLSIVDYVDNECNEYNSNEDDNHSGPCTLTTSLVSPSSSVSLSLTS